MAFKNKTTWVLVADGARARIFERGYQKLDNVMGQDFCSDNLKTREITTDKPGRVFESGATMRHAYEPRTDWHTYQKELFAKELCDVLRRSNGSFDELVLVSSPKTLGDIRSNLCKQAKDKVKLELAKDVTKLTEKELADYLDRELV